MLPDEIASYYRPEAKERRRWKEAWSETVAQFEDDLELIKAVDRIPGWLDMTPDEVASRAERNLPLTWSLDKRAKYRAIVRQSVSYARVQAFKKGLQMQARARAKVHAEVRDEIAKGLIRMVDDKRKKERDIARRAGVY